MAAYPVLVRGWMVDLQHTCLGEIFLWDEAEFQTSSWWPWSECFRSFVHSSDGCRWKHLFFPCCPRSARAERDLSPQDFFPGRTQWSFSIPLILPSGSAGFLTVFAFECICCSCCSVTKSYLTHCDPGAIACRAPLSSTVSQSLLKFMAIESVMLSNHFILSSPLLLLPSLLPDIRVFSSELALQILSCFVRELWLFNFRLFSVLCWSVMELELLKLTLFLDLSWLHNLSLNDTSSKQLP